MRLFAALLPPGHVLDGPGQLADAAAQLHSLPGAARLRFIDRANWHITLAFYGEVDEATLPELRERLSRAARRGAPMELRLSGGGRFGDRALWAGIAGAADEGGDDGRDADAGGEGRLPGVESLRRLAATAAAAGRRAGLEMEEPRRYRPHLTLARARPSAGRPVDLRPYVALLESLRSERWTAGELALVRSKLPDSGIPGEQPRYEQIAAWPLDG